MGIRSHALLPNVNLTVTPIRFDSEFYNMVGITVTGIAASGSFLDIPIGPPLQRDIQIFQIRMTCDSPSCEWSLHTQPYGNCRSLDWIYKGVTDKADELMQEVWLAPYLNNAVPPYLYFSFKELTGVSPGLVRLELRISC